MPVFTNFSIRYSLFVVKSLLLSKLNHTERRSSRYFGHFTYTHRHSDETGYGGEFPEIILIYRLWLTQSHDVTLLVTHIRIAGNRHTIAENWKNLIPPHSGGKLRSQTLHNPWETFDWTFFEIMIRNHVENDRWTSTYHGLSVVYERTLKCLHYEDRAQIKTTKPIMLDTLISANNAQKCIAYRMVTRL